MATTISPNMNLVIPSVGLEAGPEYATDINNSLDIIDSHNHAPGSGVPIDPTGLNINADLEINSNNLTEVRSVRLDEQSAAISDAADLGCVYNVDGDLYYNDALGNQIQITANGAVAGTPGSISNLVSPASASYVAANGTFVWESDVNTPASLDAADVTIRKPVANGAGITLSAPVAIAADYDIVLPALPAASAALLIDSSGNITTTAWAAILAALNPPGAVQMYAGTAAPTGYLMCDGSAKNRTTYAALFAAIGTTFGAGDGSTTFNLPDPRNVFIRGVNASTRTIGGIVYPAVTLGATAADMYQGHEHTTRAEPGSSGSGNVATSAGGFLINNASVTSTSVGNVTDGVNGTPRTGIETRPINLGMNFIIKT